MANSNFEETQMMAFSEGRWEEPGRGLCDLVNMEIRLRELWLGSLR